MKKSVIIIAFVLLSTIAHANDQQIQCSVKTRAGEHLAGETSTLGRGVDLTGEKGIDLYAYVDGRTDKRVFRVEAFSANTGDLLMAKTVSYYKSTTASLTLEIGELIFNCEMMR